VLSRSQELFAHELTLAEKVRKRLQIRHMELQYLNELGVPTLVTWSTSIMSVLGSTALLVSDRPIAELVAQGFTPPAQPPAPAADCGGKHARQARKERKQLSNGGRQSRKLLQGETASARDAAHTSRRLLTSDAG